MNYRPLIIAVMLAALVLLVSKAGLPVIGGGKATAATYVFEKDDGGVPAPVTAALSKLNSSGIRATPFEEDTTDGSGEVPDQYKVPLKAAQEAGLPALVVTAGARVLRVVKEPKTEAEVLEAVK